MTHFLWVEDFNASETKRPENIVSSTVNSVFGSLLDSKELIKELAEEDVNDAQDFLAEKGIFLKLNLLDALKFIRNPNELSKIDFVVLDVDMPIYPNDRKNNDSYLDDLIAKYPSENDLKRIAGYQIYIELVIELGFPKSHILFCSNHASYFEELKNKFSNANIKPPVSPNPNKPFLEKEDKEFIEKWLTDKQSDYFVLRRGIIEGCNYLKTLTETEFRFNEFIKEEDKRIDLLDLFNYVSVLETLLPLQEPKNKAYFYKLFVRTLAHEWEAAEPKKLNNQNELFAFSWIMKMSRNWLAHSKIFEKLTAQDVAYLFMVNIRALFDLGDKLTGYEKILLNLFEPISATDLKAKIGNDFKDRKLPLIENYAQVLKATGNTYQAINFHDALSNLQKYKINENEPEFFVKGLYQTFWFLTSNGGVFIPSEEQVKKFSVLNYQFRYFDYHKNTEDYLFELARHIYNRSFS